MEVEERGDLCRGAAVSPPTQTGDFYRRSGFWAQVVRRWGAGESARVRTWT